MTTPRLLFLIPYFGRWPFWLPFFLQSCRFNPDVQWLFFTDCGTPPNAPDNVRFRAMSFDDYCTTVSARLRIDFRPQSPYKLCDLKPALGYVPADELVGFDFWGFSDIDLVYGDLRSYFSAERLQRVDLLSTHERRISGHLCLLRNNIRMCEAFMQVPGWQAKLASSEHNAFDEGAFSRLFIRHKSWPKRAILGGVAASSSKPSVRPMVGLPGTMVVSIFHDAGFGSMGDCSTTETASGSFPTSTSLAGSAMPGQPIAKMSCSAMPHWRYRIPGALLPRVFERFEY